MEYKNPFFGAVSVLALASALPAEASTSVEPSTSTEVKQTHFRVSSDPVLDFILATNADLTPASVERGLKVVFSTMHTAQAEMLPSFVRGLWTVALSQETRELVTNTLLVMLSGSDDVDDETVDRIGTELLKIGAGAGVPYRLAQATFDDFCDFNQPDDIRMLDPDCPPITLTAPPATTTPEGGYSA